jgi:alpha-beta hydrolase superfamily lysophospholipase
MPSGGSGRDPQAFSVRVDVTGVVPRLGNLSVAAEVICPRASEARPDALLYFGYPGGGYNRHYFDLDLGQFDSRGSYSQARYHAAQGDVFVACDHVGVGDSDVPTGPLGYEDVARINTAAAKKVISGLVDGSLHPDIGPISPRATIGCGQSFGGFLLTLAQAADPVFDGVGFLGWSAIRTDPGWPPGVDVSSIVRNGARGDDPDNPRRRTYHWTDVPDGVVHADLTRAPGSAGCAERWGARYHPGGPNLVADRSPVEAGVVTKEAAAIEVPVLIAAGEIDVMADPWSEPAAYRGSADVTVCVFPRMAHMHNFSSGRQRLWERLSAWGGAVGGSRAQRH